MDKEINAELLISLVEERTVLWDKTLDLYKDKNLKISAWRDICCILRPGFEELEEKERKAFGKVVSDKWSNLRDAWMRRARKKGKDKKTSGAGAKPSRPYIYNEQMNFLTKISEPRDTYDYSAKRPRTDLDEADTEISTPTDVSMTTKALKKPKNNDIDEKMSQFLESRMKQNTEENPHLSFFKGILPALKSFTEDEILELQSGVLILIQRIKRQRCQNSSYRSGYTPTQLTRNMPTDYDYSQTGYYTQSQNIVNYPMPSPAESASSQISQMSHSSQESMTLDFEGI